MKNPSQKNALRMWRLIVLGLCGFVASAFAQDQNPAQPSGNHRPELILQTGHTYSIWRLAFSPDARLLASSGYNESAVRLWEVSTGRELRIFSSHSSGTGNFTGVMSLAFSPDGNTLAAGNSDNSIVLWDVKSGDEIRSLAAPMSSFVSTMGVMSLAFSPNGRLLASSHGDGTRIWDLASGNELHTIATSLSIRSLCTSFAFTPDSRELAIPLRGGATASSPITISRINPGASAAQVNTGTRVAFINVDSGEESHSVDLSGSSALTCGRSVAVTPSGDLLVPTIVGDTVKIWDVTAGGDPRVFPIQTTQADAKTPVALVHALSPDGHFVALLNEAGIKVWQIAAQQELKTLTLPSNPASYQNGVTFVEFSPDSRLLALGGVDGRIRVWETTTGKEMAALTGHANQSQSLVFDGSGKHLFTGGKTSWDLAAGRGHRIQTGAGSSLGYLSADGALLAQPSATDDTIQVWSTTSQQAAVTLDPKAEAIADHVAFSPNGRFLAATYKLSYDQLQKRFATQSAVASAPQPLDRDAIRAAIKSGKSINDIMQMQAQAYQQNNAQLIANDITHQVRIWDLATGQQVQSLLADTQMVIGALGQIQSISFTADGRQLVSATASGEIKLWDVSSGRELNQITNQTATVPTMGTPLVRNATTTTAVGLSPNGHLLAVAAQETSTNMQPYMDSLRAMTQQMGKSRGHGIVFGQIGNKRPSLPSVSMSKQGEMMRQMTYGVSGPIKIFDLSTGQPKLVLPGHARGATALAFSSDGRLLATSSPNNDIKLWDLASGQELRTFSGHTSGINALAFSPDGKLLVSTSADGITRLWDTQSGEHVATLISLYDGADWLVVTPDGLFDGSPAAWNQILWRFGGNTFDVLPVEIFFNEFYYPDLLADIIAGKRPHAAQNIEQKDRRQPQLKMELADAQSSSIVASRNVRVKIEIQQAAGGAQDLRLFRNGSLVKIWRGDLLAGKPSATLEATIPVVAGENHLIAYAFNHDNVKSGDAALELHGADSLRRPGEIYVLSVGVNQYANPGYNLKYAVADAKAFAEVVEQQEGKLNPSQSIKIIPLYDQEATKANILKALADLAGKVQPEDEIMIFVASHGTASQNRFYLIPHDLGYSGSRTDLDEEAVKSILAHSLSDQELEAAFEKLDVSRSLLVIDACNSGQALEAEEKRRGPMNSKGLAQLAYEKGMYVLTASQSYQAAQEVAQLGHGLLTYTLIEEGLQKGEADFEPHDGQIMAREWLSYASNRVPQVQLEKIQQARSLGRELSFAEGSNAQDPQVSQQPKLFYRRELEDSTWVIAKPGMAK